MLRTSSPFCLHRGPAPAPRPKRSRGGRGRGWAGAGPGAHPRPAAGSTAGCTAASCSPASARRRRLRCLPKPGAHYQPRPPPGPPPSPRCSQPPGAPGPAVPAKKAPMPFMKAWDWQAAYCCSACGDTLSAGPRRLPNPGPRCPHPGLPGPRRAHRVLGGHAVLHPPQPQVDHSGAGGPDTAKGPVRG